MLPSVSADADIAIALSPRGHVLLQPALEGAPGRLAPAAEARIRAAFERGSAEGLLHLGAVEVTTSLPAPFAFWRDFAGRFMSALCAIPELEEHRGQVDVPVPPAEEMQQRVLAAP